MHVPRHHFVERFRWFQFLRQHHKLHHRYYQKNFCVLFPLADYLLGTLITEESLARRRAERETAIAAGRPTAERRSKRRAWRSRDRARHLRLTALSPLSRGLRRLRARRRYAQRRAYRLPIVRELLRLGSEKTGSRE
jgi:hypothetical protein